MSTQANITEPKERIEEFNRSFKELVSLLEQQLSCISRGDMDNFERLAERSSEYVEQIGLMRMLERKEYTSQRDKLRGLYSRLCLATADQKQKTSDELEQVRKVSRALGGYRKNV